MTSPFATLTSSRGWKISPVAMGDRVWFVDEKRPYTVQAVAGPWAVLTKPFAARHTTIYTVLNLKSGLRGPDNYGGLGYETREECEHAAGMFARGEAEHSYRHKPIEARVQRHQPYISQERPCWVAEVFVGDEVVARREIPGPTTRGLAVSFVNQGLRGKLAELAGSVEALDGDLMLVGDGSANPRPLVLRGRIQRGVYPAGQDEWRVDFEDGRPVEAIARLRADGSIVWGE